MPVGFYCTVMRDASPTRKVGWLLGPYDDEPTARAMLPEARRLAYEADPRTHFDAFGTARLETVGPLPQGKLNCRIETGEISEGY